MAEAYDAVTRPAHYTQGEIECIDYIRDILTYEEYIGWLRGSITKYLHRWRDKHRNGAEDLKKAQFFQAELLKTVEGKKRNGKQLSTN
tara:strand:- start:309 stop:572 length:264 start_codon:yes stop_codon:yes gene_type:complete